MTHHRKPAAASEEAAAQHAEHVSRNVQVVTDMHVEAERTLGAHQRAIESGTARLGRPGALYVVLALVLAWTAANLMAPRLGWPVADPPPFHVLQGLLGLTAVLTAMMVLTTQNRQGKLIEQRMHLDLQVNLLTEQKAAKLIELLEELRRDLPNVRNRRDPEAESMQHAAEPRQVIAALEEQTLEAQRAPGPEDERAPEGDAVGQGPLRDPPAALPPVPPNGAR